MEWISVIKEKPKHDQICYVVNVKASLGCFLAIYHHNWDYFQLYEPTLYNHPAIEVTHWIPLPPPPRREDV